MSKEIYRFDILTLFPDFFKDPLNSSLLGKAINTGLIKVSTHNIRDFATGKHKKVDDRPFGGGPGMVLKADVLTDSLKNVVHQSKNSNTTPHIVMLDPSGIPLNQKKVGELAAKRHLILICGRYEGVDERFKKRYIDEEISIGDYVLSGGEPAALVVIDSISRLLPGFLSKEESTKQESFQVTVVGGKKQQLLDYPVYTRPEIFEGERIPEVLKGGNHANIKAWRLKQSILKTKTKRPDLNKT